MRAGLLRHRVDLQHITITNTLGDAVESATTYATSIPARITPVSALERWRAERVTPQATHEVEIRYRSDVKAADQLVFGTRTFHIVGIRNPDERRIGLLIDCEEVVAV